MAQAQLYRKRAQVFVVEETAQDTYLTQSAADAILCEIPDTAFTLDASNYETTTVRGDFLSSDETAGLRRASLNFRVPLHGSGTAGTAPEFGEALKACGYEETTDPATSVTYTPLSTFDGAGGNPGPSYSCTLLESGLAYQMKGCFGNVVFEGVVGEPMFLNFTFSGANQAVADDGLETATYDTPVAQPFMGATFALNYGGAITPKGVNNFTLDTGNQVVHVNDINETYGVYGARIVSRKSIGSFDPEMELVANTDYFGIWSASTAGTIATGTIGATAGNIWSLSIARAVLRPPELSDRDGIRTLNVPFAVSSAGTDVEGTNPDISLVFT